MPGNYGTGFLHFNTDLAFAGDWLIATIDLTTHGTLDSFASPGVFNTPNGNTEPGANEFNFTSGMTPEIPPQVLPLVYGLIGGGVLHIRRRFGFKKSLQPKAL